MSIDGSHIVSSKAGQGRFYQSAVNPPGGYAGMMQKMKNYILSRGSWMDSNIAADDGLIE